MNTNLDVPFVVEQLHRVGSELTTTFSRQQPVVGMDALIKSFKEINGAAERSLRQGLESKYPQFGWADDELEDAKSLELIPPTEFWICDAIDGAVQFLRGIPAWCISLTLMRERAPVFCAIYDPLHGELYQTRLGMGAQRNGKNIQVNGQEKLENAIVAMSQPPFVYKHPDVVERSGRLLAALLGETLAVRNLGPTSLQIAQVASGRLDAFIEFGCDDFNCVGASLIAREAGAHTTDFAGKPYGLRAESLIVGSPGIHLALRNRLCTI